MELEWIGIFNMSQLADSILIGSLITGCLSASVALYGRYYSLPVILTGSSFCHLEDGGCEVLFRSENAALLILPSSLYGILFYLGMASGIFFNWPQWALFVGASGAFAMSIFLALSLIRQKRECRVCWIGHWSNLIIWVILFGKLVL